MRGTSYAGSTGGVRRERCSSLCVQQGITRETDMRRRDISKALLFTSASGAAGLIETAQGQTCTPPCYAITAPETAAGVTVFQTQYLPGDIRRYYGGESDWTAAL